MELTPFWCSPDNISFRIKQSQLQHLFPPDKNQGREFLPLEDKNAFLLERCNLRKSVSIDHEWADVRW